MTLIIAILSAVFAKSLKQCAAYSAIAAFFFSLLSTSSVKKTSEVLQQPISDKQLWIAILMTVVASVLVASLFYFLKQKRPVFFKKTADWKPRASKKNKRSKK